MGHTARHQAICQIRQVTLKVPFIEQSALWRWNQCSQDSINKYLMWSLRQQEPRYLTLFLENFQVKIKIRNEKYPRVVLLERQACEAVCGSHERAMAPRPAPLNHCATRAPPGFCPSIILPLPSSQLQILLLKTKRRSG